MANTPDEKLIGIIDRLKARHANGGDLIKDEFTRKRMESLTAKLHAMIDAPTKEDLDRLVGEILQIAERIEAESDSAE